MTRIRIVGLCFVVALALGAVTASSSLALPEVGRCVVNAKHEGQYEDKNCTKKAKKVSEKFTGEFDKVKNVLKTGFTATSGESFLEGKSGLKVVCKEAVAKGKYDSDGTTPSVKGVESVVATFTGCGIPAVGVECNTEGHPAGEIITKELEGNLGYIKKTAPKEVGQELKPHTKGGEFANFNCTSAFHIVVKECNSGSAVCGAEEKGGNCIISKLAPINTMSLTGTSTYKVKEGLPGVQEPQHFENLKPPICNLENTTNGEKNERSTQNEVATVTGEEELELFA
jgi:hypothetical protein